MEQMSAEEGGGGEAVGRMEETVVRPSAQSGCKWVCALWDVVGKYRAGVRAEDKSVWGKKHGR